MGTWIPQVLNSNSKKMSGLFIICSKSSYLEELVIYKNLRPISIFYFIKIEIFNDSIYYSLSRKWGSLIIYEFFYKFLNSNYIWY